MLSNPATSEEAQSLAATIIGSLANGAQAPTLLALCRADTTSALLKALEKQANYLSQLDAEEFASQLSSASSTLARHIKLLESFLRALRSFLTALANHVRPSNANGRADGDASAGPTFRSGGNGRGSPRFSLAGTSVREVSGWHLADAGFAKSNQQIDISMFRPLNLLDSDNLVSPEDELFLRARQEIDLAYQPSNLRYWLGALFLAQIPRSKPTDPFADRRSNSSSRMASANNSRASTRPSSPALAGIASPALHGSVLSRSSSRMSLASDAVQSSPSPTLSNQVCLLTITEMISDILSLCLSIPHFQGMNVEPISASKYIEQRRAIVLDFTASISPYWCPSQGRGRSSQGVMDSLQGSFVKRGKSTDGSSSSIGREVPMSIDEAGPATIAAFGATIFVDESKNVLEVLLDAIECGFARTQEAALWAIHDICRESREANRRLFSLTSKFITVCQKPESLPFVGISGQAQAPTTMLLNLRKDAALPVRLAALCCLAHIIKVDQFTLRANECVLAGLVELMEVSGSVQVRAISGLSELVADDVALQDLASGQYECIEKLINLLNSTRNIQMLPASRHLRDSTHTTTLSQSGFDEHLTRLREVVLGALASLCFQRDELRRKFVDSTVVPPPLTIVVQSLSASRIGVRANACRLVRALSRSISILRTSLVDAGVAPKLLVLLQDDQEEPQVKIEALAAICNLVIKFSPMKQMLIEGDGLSKIAALTHESHNAMVRLNAFWAIRNALYYSESSQKERIMQAVGWDQIRRLSQSTDSDLQCEALNIIRNLSSNSENDVEMTLAGMGGGEALLDLLESVIWQRQSSDAIEQSAYILVNIAAGSDGHRKIILDRSNLLDALVFFLNYPQPNVRVAGIWAINNLTQSSNTSGESP